MLNNKTFSEAKELDYSSVQKAIGILLSFVPENKPIGTLQLSQLLGLNKSTVSRLIQVLVHFGLIQQDEASRKYSLGRTAALLGKAVEGSQMDRLIQFARPEIEYLRDTFGESVCCEVLLSGGNKVIAEAIGPPPLSVTFEDYLPMHVAAGAKSILAFTDSGVVDSMIKGELEKFTENTITDVNAFKDQLREIRQRGIAYDHGEANKDVHAVSAPVFNQLKEPIAAISICVPAGRINKILDHKVGVALKEAAKRITERLFPPVSG
jgi:DNA-binding IclR family transcriptional regulator